MHIAAELKLTGFLVYFYPKWFIFFHVLSLYTDIYTLKPGDYDPWDYNLLAITT